MPRIGFSSALVEVAGSKGAVYLVEIFGDVPWSCTCKDYEYRAIHVDYKCKHMQARCGKKAVGTTRCGRCLVWLSLEDLRDRPASAKDAAICAGCKGVVS